ncbi:RDD family protein [Tsuneonella mangrovi]|uniref:RDD family protein n=1 Tax=Tsuneonella mangrovi TaxID=1982042 RepID=UPI000BA2656D|nr:RDD family protein [Tsuneonella mangrovi]
MTAASIRFTRDPKRERICVTPEGIALTFVVATRSARLGALLIDYMILLFGSIFISIAMGMILGGIGSLVDAKPAGAAEFVVALWVILWFVAWNGYFMIFELSARGATPGKRLTGIRVAARPASDHEGSARLTAEAVIARNLLRDIELFLPLILVMSAPSGAGGPAGLAATAWFLVFAFFPFFNRDALRAGDLIAGTWVVEAPRTKLADALSVEGAAKGASSVTGATYQFGDAELSIYGEYELQTLERMLRDGQQEALEAVHTAICTKIGWSPGAGDERAFLEAFYAQLRAKLEGDMRFGKRKADKFSA